MSERITFVLGTRPEIIKLAPIIHACSDRDIPCTIIHSGQHYSDTLDTVFFDQLGLPEPDYNLGIGSAPQGKQTGEMIIGIERALRDDQPTSVLVQGDTNTVLAGSIAASKMDLQLGHVEAGLRSYDREMPEELNRIIADHVSDSLFAPTNRSKRNLLQEGIPDSRVKVTGNTVVDALYRNRQLAREKSSVLSDLGLDGQEFFLMTLHRQENVDNEELFRALLFGASRAADKHDVPVVYPIHPRAEKQLSAFGIEVPEPIRVIEPCQYLDFLRLEDEAALVMTDSGGVQEETCILRTPCVTLRDSTERPETVSVGANVLTDHDPPTIISSVSQMLRTDTDWRNPFGDGKAGERILQAVMPQMEEVHL